MIAAARETALAASEYISCIGKSALGSARPLADPERVQAMIDASDLVIGARDEAGELVGICRCVTDWHWVAYCSDLAVAEHNQGQGIGRQLLDEAQRLLGPKVGLALLTLPPAEGFYRKIGMTPEQAFWRDRDY